MPQSELFSRALRLQQALADARADVAKHATDAREAYRVRDLAREASNRDLEAKRRAEQLAANWQETAEQELRNTQYYRSLVVEIGTMLGMAARTADDGSIAEDILCAKVPELVRAALGRICPRCERLQALVQRVRQGYLNILEMRSLQNGRYGNLTREEVEGVIEEITAALKTP